MNIRIEDDLDLKKIAESGQAFRIRELEDGWFLFITGDCILRIRRSPSGDGGLYETDCSPEKWEQVWSPYFDLGRNYREIRESVPDSDPFLRKAAECGKGLRILRQDPWEMLITFIISQRKNIPAIRSCVEKLAENFGKPLSSGGERICSFPRPEELEGRDLSCCSLGYREKYVREAAKAAASGVIDPDSFPGMDDEALTKTLLSVYGVGRKIADCVSLFGCGRTGRAPVDTWIGRIIANVYNGSDPFPAYRDAAGIMQQYVFYYTIHNKDKIRQYES